MSSGILGYLMDHATNILKDEKGTAVLGLVIIFLFYHAFIWASDKHDGLVQMEQFETLENKVESGFENAELNDASQAIRLLKIDLRIAKATGATDTELASMEEGITAAKAYKQCLVHRDPNCEHLKNPE